MIANMNVRATPARTRRRPFRAPRRRKIEYEEEEEQDTFILYVINIIECSEWAARRMVSGIVWFKWKEEEEGDDQKSKSEAVKNEINQQTNDRINQRTNEWTNNRTNESTNAWMNEGKNEQENNFYNGWHWIKIRCSFINYYEFILNCSQFNTFIC